ncbi:MAG TPA: ABC transporter permease, partial [Gemmataceae bacterium]|nr:ABC transporter permease [Gemmataceae bacterium]
DEEIMSSNAITDKRDDSPQSARWQAPIELAPSSVQDAAPLWSRWVGAFGLALVVLGGVSMLTWYFGRTSFIGPVLGGLFVFLGLGGLLFHAANDAEQQIRRAYLGFGLAWLATGAVLSLIPVKLAGMEASAVGALFLPFGLFCFLMGLLFTMAFVRNEAEAKVRDLGVFVVGGAGLAFALAGFLGGTISPQFLVPYGVVLIPLGFVFLWVFVSMRGIADDLGYWAALGVGVLGFVFFLVALGRSYLPPILERLGAMQPGAAPYAMPWGLLLMFGGALYLLLSVAYLSDRQVVVLTRRELGSLFFSPLAYFVLLAYTVLGGYVFLKFTFRFLWPPMLWGGPPPSRPEPIIANYIIDWEPMISVIMLVPVLTMRSFSEERRTGTLEMILTAPVEETVMVVSKFLSALILFLAVWVPWGLYLVALRAFGGSQFDYRPAIGFSLALLITGSAFTSMGVFFSSLTRNQLTAAVFTFVFMFALFLLYFIRGFLPEGSAWDPILGHAAFVEMWINALQGRLAMRDLVLYLSATLFWLFLTVKVLESRKWR